MILSLRSLANVGVAFKDGDIETLESCFEDKDNPVEVRIAALQGLRYYLFNGSIKKSVSLLIG